MSATSTSLPRKDLESGRFLTGNSGGPGRPKGSRNRLSEDFLAGLQADFEEHGPAVIAQVRKDRPHEYLKIVASVLPREMQINSEAPREVHEYSTAELLAIIAEFRPASRQTER